VTWRLGNQSARAVDKAAVDQFLADSGIEKAFETSAKDRTGVVEAFTAVSKSALANLKEEEGFIQHSMLPLNKDTVQQKKGSQGRCC